MKRLFEKRIREEKVFFPNQDLDPEGEQNDLEGDPDHPTKPPIV